MRIRILLYFQLQIVKLFNYTYVVLPNAIIITNTLTSLIPAAKHINAVTSSYSFQHIIMLYLVYDQGSPKYIDVRMCSPHFPHLFLFVHLSKWGLPSFVSISTEALLLHKTVTLSIRWWWLCMQPFHPRHDGCVVGMPEYPSDMSCNFDVVSWSA